MSLPEHQLTPENHLKGFLIDEELMGGVSPIAGSQSFSVFVIRHTTGELLGSSEAPNLETALSLINSVRRDWVYESASQCGGQSCNEGNCGTGSCKKVLSRLNSGSPSPEACESNGPCPSPNPAQ
jgi:hypothetical protein